ncbi:hypothetical protein ES702_00556 [subsurface metagenome]
MKVLLVQVDGNMTNHKYDIGVFPYMPYIEWTSKEVALLRQAYREKISPELLLPHRTYGSIRHKASRLGLKWWELEDVCRVCGVELTEDNWYPAYAGGKRGKDHAGRKRGKDRICKSCTIKRNKEYVNPEWATLNQLHTKGVTYLCRKRAKPDLCELCGEKPPKAYHHWGPIIEGEYVPGIWVDHRCHQFAELFDKDFSERYQELKEAILTESSVNSS